MSTVITITDATFRVADDEASLATADATFECQVIEASVNAVPNLQPVPATWCNPASQTPAATGWELVMTWLQDWTAPGGGLSGYAFTHDTELKWFSLTLESDPLGPPICTGQVRVVAGSYGGAAGTPLQTSATWPLPAKPTIDTPALAGP